MPSTSAPPGPSHVEVGTTDGECVVSVRDERTGRVVGPLRTRYPEALVRLILDVKGPSHVCDEIGREQDPTSLQAHLVPAVTAHLDPQSLLGARVLDFGCGGGASTCVLARALPGADLVGVDLEPRHLDIARARAVFRGLTNASFVCSPEGAALPPGLGTFDVVVLSAVFEHLLPAERRALMPLLWQHLRPGGVLVVDETPWRWSPVESHTTGLPLVNYLPRAAAHATTRWRAQHGAPHLAGRDWTQLLRAGIRGATRREVLRSLGPSSGATVLTPHRLGVDNHVDLFFLGYGGSLGRARRLKRAVRRSLVTIERRTGLAVVPYLTLALRKPDAAEPVDA